MLKTYYMLTKPGIIVGNLITTASGFLLASRGNVDLFLFFVSLVGLGLVIASACVFNNAIDKSADAKMERTKNRPLVKGLISVRKALIFATLMLALGGALLAIFTNVVALGTALFGFFFYVVMYSVWKYRGTSGTVIGSVAGAVPPVVGYTAVSGRIDAGALILFAILVLWQMPHFYSIAMYRFKEYEKASIPVLPVVKGMHTTKIYILFYVLAFMGATTLLLFFNYTGYLYLVTALTLGTLWLLLSLKGFRAKNDAVWAHKMFRLSLVVVTTLSLMISIDTV